MNSEKYIKMSMTAKRSKWKVRYCAWIQLDNVGNNTSEGLSPVSRPGDCENEFNQSGFNTATKKGLKPGNTMTIP